MSVRITRFVLAALVACTGSSGPAPSPPPKRPATDSTQDHVMIQFVSDLAQHVANGARTTDALTSRLGKVQPEGDDPAILIVPSDPRFTQIRIARRPDGSPFTIRLALALALSLAELKSAFGAYKTLERSDPDMPWPLIFTDVVRGSFADVSLMVEVAGPLEQLEKRDVSSVTLRIDPH